MWASPAAIALYAPLALLVSNRFEVHPLAAVRPILASLAIAIVVIAVCGLLFRPSERAVILACVILIAVFTYGHLYDALKQLGPAAISLARHRYLLPLEALLLIGLAWLLRFRRGWGPALARWLTGFAWILLAFPLMALLQLQARDWTPAGRAEALAGSAPDSQAFPDIFYVILDGYGRSDVLQDSYGYDNGPFLDFLRSRGFYIAEKAMSNYSRTLLSMTSSLNMAYLDSLLAQGDERSLNRLVRQTLHDNQVFHDFRRLGYGTVAFETGYPPTELREADEYLSPNYGDFGQDLAAFTGAGLNEFEGMFLQTTMATVGLDFYLKDIQRRAPGVIDYEYDKHRTRVLFTIASLSDIIGRPGAHLVVAHIISPHPPFVFGPRGERLSHDSYFSLADECCEGDEYLERYVGQMEYLNGALRTEIDEILEASGGEAIIVLQGDHGPAGLLDWGEPSEAGIRDRMAILNAYRLPAPAAETLDPTITPVNSFRVILSEVFGMDFERLMDASYFTRGLELSDAIRVLP